MSQTMLFGGPPQPQRRKGSTVSECIALATEGTSLDEVCTHLRRADALGMVDGDLDGVELPSFGPKPALGDYTWAWDTSRTLEYTDKGWACVHRRGKR